MLARAGADERGPQGRGNGTDTDEGILMATQLLNLSAGWITKKDVLGVGAPASGIIRTTAANAIVVDIRDGRITTKVGNGRLSFNNATISAKNFSSERFLYSEVSDGRSRHEDHRRDGQHIPEAM
ncbi:hypothetical protein DdX_18484 [Ditylenchus destructor]|uniref:Uncharacterized protein n=1 Tax=Ditylenchus destructor TaxID=166010 RepID=A0AAD4MKM6_9BILA|nr:hypothetical protein DdX_18484 [Ditylenchus destructor]